MYLSLKKPNVLIALFLFFLFIINLAQGYFTELLEDEAYYWVYSNFMDWGFFDHPPMVAVWISISKLFFSNGELSVRFFSALTLSVNFYLVWLLTKRTIQYVFTKKDIQLFIILILSTALFNLYGFITVPDTPLMLFTALFLLGYQKYLHRKSLISYSILAVSMAALLYSKYHGVLIIIFVLLSNLKLLKDYKIWITAFVSLALFFPHLYWQYANDFPSVKYHLFERSSRAYRIDFTTNHFLNLIAIIGFTFPVVYTAYYKNLKNKDLFQKSLNFIVLGFAIFFFLMSFKNHVQAQWIVPISIPLIIITFNYLIRYPKKQKLFKILAYISLAVIVYLRLALVFDELLPKQFDMHGNKKWATELQNKLNGKKPIFLNSYQNTSTYWFYSGEKPYQYNSFDSRKNQFELLKKDFDCTTLSNIAEIGGRNTEKIFSIKKRNKDSLNVYFINNYRGINQLKYAFEKMVEKENLLNKSSYQLPVIINSPYEQSISANSFNVKVVLFDKHKRKITTVTAKNITKKEHLIKGNNTAYLYFSTTGVNAKPYFIQVIGKSNPKTSYFRMSDIKKLPF